MKRIRYFLLLALTFMLGGGVILLHASGKIRLKVTPNSDDLGYVVFDWSRDSAGNPYAFEDKNYFLYSSSDGGNKYNRVGIDYESVSEVRCLQIYPEIPQIKDWVVNSGYGQGKIIVDEVYFDTFNKNPEQYLHKDANGNWNYDVIYVGTWDRNKYWDFSAKSYEVVDKFVKAGKGCIFGHDTIQDNSFYSMDNKEYTDGALKYDHEYMNRIASDYFKALYRKSTPSFTAPSYSDNKVRIVRQGLFTTYPNYVGGIGTVLNIPSCHTWGQGVTPGYENNIWLKFGEDNNDSDNFYMITDNNMAMFQTGHSNGQSTADEQKIIANLLFYCNQLISNSYRSRDMASQDLVAPGKVSVVERNGLLDCSAVDNGSSYKYYIEAYTKDDTTPSGLLERSDIVDCTVRTYVREYRYTLNNSSNTIVNTSNSLVKDGSGAAGVEDLVTSFNIEDIQNYDYLHIAAVDGAGNIGETTHIKIPHEANYKAEYWLEKLNGDYNIQDDQNYDLKESKVYKGVILDRDIPKKEEVLYYPGFLCIDNGNKDGSQYVKANNLTKLNMYYRRIKYNIEYSPGESFATGTVEPQNIKWGETFSIRDNNFSKKYTYNLDPNGGIVDSGEDKLIEEHKFKHWYFNNNGVEGRLESGNYTEGQLISTEEQQFTVNDADKIVLEAIWENGSIVLPSATKEGADFIGWFNVAQEVGNQNLEAKLLGKAGDKVTLDDLERRNIQDKDKNNEFTLYAWYNKRPVFVNLYNGLFFEGQEVSYNDLLELVGIWDYDDNYQEIVQDKINKYFNNLKEEVDNDIEDINKEIYYMEEERDNLGGDEDYTEDIKELRNRLQRMFTERQKIESVRREAIRNARARKLEPVIAKITYIDGEKELSYYSNEITSNGLEKAIKNTDYASTYLDTRTSNIGNIEITYQVHDSGIYYKDWTHPDDLEADEEIEGKILIDGSEITMEYTRKCQINFNYNPLLNLQNLLYYTETDFGDSLSEFVLKRQLLRDSEDIQDNIPWWSSRKDVKNLLFNKSNEDSIGKLQNTLEITSVGDEIGINSVFENEFSEACNQFREEIQLNNTYTKAELLDYIYSFKGDNDIYWEKDGLSVTKADIWNNITSISITFDGHDQFGKYASNRVSDEGLTKGVDTSSRPKGYKAEFNGGYLVDESMNEYDVSIYQTDFERTIYLMLINIKNDSELAYTRTQDDIRYINRNHLGTLENSYWGTTGLEDITRILNKSIMPGDEAYIDREGDYRDRVKVKIKDYTN